MAALKRSGTRRAKRALPLSLRIAGIYAMLVAATLLVVAGLALQFTRSQVTNQVDGQLTAAAESFRYLAPRQVAMHMQRDNMTFTEALVTTTETWLSTEPFTTGQGAYVKIQNYPKLLESAVGIDLVNTIGGARFASLFNPSAKQWTTLHLAGGASIRMLRVPILIQGSGPAGTVLLAGSQSSQVDNSVWSLLKDIALASLIGLAFATMLGLVVVRRTLRPLERMSHEVESIQETDDLSKRVGGHGPQDEVGRLAEAFDRMLGRLQESFLSQRRFLSDASHELRTPMTVVRGQLELLAMDVESLAGRRSMSIAVEELDRMGRIVEDLLLLARLDEGMSLALQVVEVELVVGEALLRGMLDPGEVRVTVEPELCVMGDPDRLLQVLTNLVTNAVRHGRNAPIAISGRREGEVVKIEVADQGPGISPEDLPHVFERLYRGSKARSESPGGAGLGLAIAASLVKAMGGRIEVASTQGVGTTFTVTLHAADPIPVTYRRTPRTREPVP